MYRSCGVCAGRAASTRGRRRPAPARAARNASQNRPILPGVGQVIELRAPAGWTPTWEPAPERFYGITRSRSCPTTSTLSLDYADWATETAPSRQARGQEPTTSVTSTTGTMASARRCLCAAAPRRKARSSSPAGSAWIGSCLRKRPRSSASAGRRVSFFRILLQAFHADGLQVAAPWHSVAMERPAHERSPAGVFPTPSRLGMAVGP